MENGARQVWRAWISEEAKIVSFTPAEGYRPVDFSGRGFFLSQILELASQGYRFQ